MASLRNPRFERVDNLSPIQITERDSDIVRQIARYRFLRSSHVTQLVGGSRQQVLRRLQLLYHHGYLERPRAQIEYFHRDGGAPLVYGLANKGAALLRRMESIAWPDIDWSWKNGSIERPFLKHALLVSEIMIAFEVACRHSDTVRLITEDVLRSQLNGQPFQWNVTLPTGHTVGVIPDQVFALEFKSAVGETERIHFFLEADTGTMPVTRSTHEQTSIYRKLIAYESTWRQKIHQKRFGFQRFRVLTVTQKPDRLAEILSAGQKLKTGKGLFLFNQSDNLCATGPLQSHWSTPGPKTSLSLIG